MRHSPWAAVLAVIVISAITLGLVELSVRLLLPARSGRDGPTNPCAAPGWCNPSREVRRIDESLPYGVESLPHADVFVPFIAHGGGGYQFRTNGLGLRRDGEVAIPKPGGLFRVLVLGDSQVEGYVNNDEHYPHHLEQLLRMRSSDQQIEVLNAAVGGYGPSEYYHWYRTRGAELEPDLVIVTVYLGNDLLDFQFGETMGLAGVPTAAVDWEHSRAVAARWTGEVSDLPRATREWLPRAADQVLHHYSLVYRIVQNAVRNGPLTIPLIKLNLLDPSGDTVQTASLRAVFGECYGCWPQYFAQATAVSSARLERARSGLQTLLTLMNREVTARGGRLAVVLLPAKSQVEPDDERDALDRAASLLDFGEAERISLDRAKSDVVFDAASGAGAPVVDPSVGLAKAARSERLYYRRDWHLNATGHSVLAEIVAEQLVGQRMVP